MSTTPHAARFLPPFSPEPNLCGLLLLAIAALGCAQTGWGQTTYVAFSCGVEFTQRSVVRQGASVITLTDTPNFSHDTIAREWNAKTPTAIRSSSERTPYIVVSIPYLPCLINDRKTRCFRVMVSYLQSILLPAARLLFS